MINKLQYSVDCLNGLIATAAPNVEEVTESLQDMKNRNEYIIKSLAQELAIKLIDILYTDDKDDHISMKPVFDTYGQGIEVSWTGTVKEENSTKFAKTFKAIQTLNFMDFYQHFNSSEYIRDSISLFTDEFKSKILKLEDTYLPGDELDFYKQVVELLELEDKEYELMVSRQEIVQPVNTLKDSLSNIEIFKNDPKKLELVINEAKTKENQTIVIDKITIYKNTFLW